MKKQLWAVMIAAIVGSGCGGSKEKSNLSSDGLLGKLPSIVADYKKADSALEAEAKTSAKSMDDLVKFQSKQNKMKEDAKKEFDEEVAKMKLPVTVPFVDSTDGKLMKIQSVQITELKWDYARIMVKAQLLSASEKTMGGQVLPTEAFGWMIDKAGAPVKSVTDNWFIAMSTQELKQGDVAELTSTVNSLAKTATLAKMVFRSKDDWKKAKGFNY